MPLSEALETSAGSPVAISSKRETLTSRARRFLGGRPLDTSDENSPPAETSSSRKGVKKSPTRRREQVLQAQRTHRQRTQGYIRELEKEVLNLRNREAVLIKEYDALSMKADSMRQILLSNGLITADDSDIGALQHYVTPSSTSTQSGITSSLPSITVDLTELANTEAHYGCSTRGAEEEGRPYEQPALDFDVFLPISADGLESSQEQQGGSNMSSLGSHTGIDFVLELERPCLPHVKYRYLQDFDPHDMSKYPEYDAGPGHVFMATSNLVNSPWASEPITRPFQVPNLDIENLLRSSLTLDLGGDVTPVQIWANIERVSSKRPINSTSFGLLRDEFAKYVRCNGFGAVVEKGTANSVFSFFFPGEELIIPKD